jgi:hypothetical protein
MVKYEELKGENVFEEAAIKQGWRSKEMEMKGIVGEIRMWEDENEEKFG